MTTSGAARRTMASASAHRTDSPTTSPPAAQIAARSAERERS
jgi:hypothetical protein